MTALDAIFAAAGLAPKTVMAQAQVVRNLVRARAFSWGRLGFFGEYRLHGLERLRG